MKAFLIAVSLVVLLLNVVSSCASEELARPTPLTFDTPLLQADVQQVQADYSVNVASADAKYKGKRFYFGQVVVDKVEKDVYPLRAPEEFVLSGDVQFKPSFRGMLNEVAMSSVVEISGEVTGKMPWGYILVSDCWVRLVSGGSTVAPGY